MQIQDECTSKVRRQREQDVGTEKDSADFGKRDNFILKTIVEMQQSGVIDTKMLQDHINTILVAVSFQLTEKKFSAFFF